MPRRFPLVAASVLLAGAAGMVVTTAARATTGVTSSTITSPHSKHFMLTDANSTPRPTFTVTGTTNGTAGDFVDIRCYSSPFLWQTGPSNVPVQNDGTFSVSVREDVAYGSCVLRAVAQGLAGGSNVRSYSGPVLTTEWRTSQKITAGPNTGKIFDFYAEYQSAGAMNDYCSASCGGLWDSRLQFPGGAASNELWYGNGTLFGSTDNGTRSALQVDTRNAYLPKAADQLFSGSDANSGFKGMSFSASKNPTTGTTTVRSVEPVVRCSTNTYPATAASCPSFVDTGVRLERTITAYDRGRQVRISDVWRSTNHAAHTVSAHYQQAVEAREYAPPSTEIAVGLKLPWLSKTFRTLSSPKVFNGPGRAPGSVFVRDDNTAPQGSQDFPRGAISFDVAPSKVAWDANGRFRLRDDGIKVPAGGTALVRQAFVIGTSDAEVAAKAAANQRALNPYRPDALVKLPASHHWIGNRVYGTHGSRETLIAKTHAGSSATFDIQVQNDGTTADSFTVKGPGSGAGYRVRYVTGASGGHPITSAVAHGSYTVASLLPGRSRIVRLVVTAPRGASAGSSRSWLVVVTSRHDGSRKDAVKATVRVV